MCGPLDRITTAKAIVLSYVKIFVDFVSMELELCNKVLFDRFLGGNKDLGLPDIQTSWRSTRVF